MLISEITLNYEQVSITAMITTVIKAKDHVMYNAPQLSHTLKIMCAQ